MVWTSSKWVNFEFEVKFDLEGQGQLSPKTIGTLTKVFCIFGPNLAILAWTGPELSRGQASDWHTYGQTDRQTDTHTQTQATTIPEGQNWPRVKTTQDCQKLKFHQIQINSNINQCFPKQFWCWSWQNGLAYSNIPFFVVYGKSPQGITQSCTSLSWANPHSHAVPVAGQEGVQFEIM